ncbi:MAG: 16S rRNA (adenine(1518)-N(6)/adenine(1519)-N(6))-dimethyltransferase RsmA [Acidobacteriota bacterium]
MRAKKSLGQNFLRDESVIRQIVGSLDLNDRETVLEIGPGRGALTERLLDTGSNVIAIEIDRELVPVLRTQFHFQRNFKIIEANILETSFASFTEGLETATTKIVGNLPYYISTAILQKLAEERQLFSKAVFMLQREVVSRITAKPGDSERGFLTILTEAAFEVRHLFDVAPTAFTPQPKVWSSVVELVPKAVSSGDSVEFRKLLSSAFAQKRKTILNNLRSGYADAAKLLDGCNIDPRRRAETLTLDEWISLTESIGR